MKVEILKFIIDTQLPPALVQLLKKLGADAIHTTSFTNGHLLNDKAIRKVALEENRIIITKDVDFYNYYLIKGSPPKILRLEIGNISNKELFDIIQKNFEHINNLFQTGNDVVILTKERLLAY